MFITRKTFNKHIDFWIDNSAKWYLEAETATEKERERIIKLLEGYQGLTGMFALERDDLIALIKGEK